eukprot:jgi/Chrzof1/6467/Cz18g12050.t1
MSNNSPHRQTEVWKMLHGAPPTPPQGVKRDQIVSAGQLHSSYQDPTGSSKQQQHGSSFDSRQMLRRSLDEPFSNNGQAALGNPGMLTSAPHQQGAGGQPHHLRNAWGSQDFGRQGAVQAKLPPLEIAQDAPWQLMAGRNSPARLAPLQPPAAVANQHYASNGHSTDIEQRLAVTEARAAAAERAAVEAARLAELTGQRLTGLTGDMARATAELGDLRGRYDAASSLNGQLQQQLSTLSSDLHQQNSRLAEVRQHATAEGAKAEDSLRQQMTGLSEHMRRLASERAADHTAIQSLKQALHESSLVSADEARSRDVSIRSELRQRQQALLTDMSALASEVDGYRWVVMMTHVHQFILSFCFTSYIPGSSY